MRVLLLLLLLAGLIAGDQPLFTDQEWAASQPKPGIPAAEAPGWGSVAGLAGGLLAVIGLAVALGFIAKRLNAQRLLSGRGQRLELLESIQIAPRRSLALVRVEGTWLVVGVGEKEVTHVATLPAPAAGVSAPAPPPPPSAFAGELDRLLPSPPEARP